MSNPIKSSNDHQILSSLIRFCGYQERCENEVVLKLIKLGVTDPEKIDEWLRMLLDQEVVNDKRFCKLYSIGRFRLKRWGKIKIRFKLKGKGLKEEDIDYGLNSIEDEEYTSTILMLIEYKNRMVRTTDIYQRRHKISRFIISKGFEPDQVWKALNQEVQ